MHLGKVLLFVVFFFFFGCLIPQLNPVLYAFRGLLLCFRKEFCCFSSNLNLIKAKGAERGGRRKEHKCAPFCTRLCAGHVGALNPQYTLWRRNRISVRLRHFLPFSVACSSLQAPSCSPPLDLTLPDTTYPRLQLKSLRAQLRRGPRPPANPWRRRGTGPLGLAIHTEVRGPGTRSPAAEGDVVAHACSSTAGPKCHKVHSLKPQKCVLAALRVGSAGSRCVSLKILPGIFPLLPPRSATSRQSMAIFGIWRHSTPNVCGAPLLVFCHC